LATSKNETEEFNRTREMRESLRRSQSQLENTPSRDLQFEMGKLREENNALAGRLSNLQTAYSVLEADYADLQSQTSLEAMASSAAYTQSSFTGEGHATPSSSRVHWAADRAE
jgi:FtsZ-binding cell division protein ZapB